MIEGKSARAWGDRFDIATLVRAQPDDPASARIIYMLTHLVFSLLDAFGQIDKAPSFLILTSRRKSHCSAQQRR